MKIVIIGGGIAGLTLANFLQDEQFEVVVNERVIGAVGGGHAFLMHSDGLSVLQELAVEHAPTAQNASQASRHLKEEVNQQPETSVSLPGQLVERFILRRPDGKEVQHLPLDNWRCIKRTELTQFLYAKLPDNTLRDNRKFERFIYEDDRIVAAAFENGDVEYGDLFVGADGGFSRVRQALWGHTDFIPGRVKEVVGIASNHELAEKYRGTFNKFQRDDRGLAFGMIPSSGDELVWFMQYDPEVSDITSPDSATELEAFCRRLLAEFPPLVQNILNSNDFSTSYIWKTRDFEVLSSFSHKNVVLIGDAAHLALPFTSAGTTNAMLDAQMLATNLKQMDYPGAFQSYYKHRSKEVSAHLKLGRALRDVFLMPSTLPDDQVQIPLIADKLRSR
jgi:2-polyprenyl-6-methoxyphenol hydroxylase-like FAD-dependent oxidoreductase